MHYRSFGGVVVLVMVACARMRAGAQDAPEDLDAVLVFPNIVADGVRDTLIEVSSAGAVSAFAHCWYIESLEAEPAAPPDVPQVPAWTLIDFELALTQLEPIVWVASRGRRVSAEGACTVQRFHCDGSGTDAGMVPPLPAGFRGELHCVEVDEAGVPLSRNHLAGEATLADLISGDVTTYRALRFGGVANDDPVEEFGAEYRGCTATGAEPIEASGRDVSATRTPEIRGSRERTIVPLPVQRERAPTS